jgi:DNA-binding beta-propeller fold protein YncE
LTASAVGLLGACGEQFEPPRPPQAQLNFPVGLELHPNGRFLYVVNSNFNARYRADSGGTVAVVDTRTMEIIEGGTPFLPSFGGEIELNDNASRAYVATREDDAVVAFRVGKGADGAKDGGALFCLDGEGEPTSNPAPCTIDRIPDTGEGSPLSTDPFGLEVTTLERTNPETGDEVTIDLVNVAYVGSNRVSTISLPDQTVEGASLQTAALVPGSNQIVRRPGTLSYYVAGRNTNVVARFAPFMNFGSSGNFGEVEGLFEQGEIPLSNFVTSNGNRVSADARGIAFDETGETLYVATRRPDNLYVFSLVSSDPETGGGLEHRLTASIPLRDNPSDIVLHEGPDGRQLLYIPSFDDQSINVVDPQAKTVVDVIELDASPYDLVVDTSSKRCQTPGQTCRAYVSLFDDTTLSADECEPNSDQCGSVGVLDLDPASPRFNQMIRKIR